MRWGHGSRLRMCALTRSVGIRGRRMCYHPAGYRLPDAMSVLSGAARFGRNCPRSSGRRRRPAPSTSPTGRWCRRSCSPRRGRRAAVRSYRLPIRRRAPSPSDDQHAGGGEQQPAEQRRAPGRADAPWPRRPGRPAGSAARPARRARSRTTAPTGRRCAQPHSDDARRRRSGGARRGWPAPRRTRPAPTSASGTSSGTSRAAGRGDRHRTGQRVDDSPPTTRSRRRRPRPAPRRRRPGSRPRPVAGRGRLRSLTAAGDRRSAQPPTGLSVAAAPTAAITAAALPWHSASSTPARNRPPPRRRPARRRSRRRPARCGW